jgi:hypothetical protein
MEGRVAQISTSDANRRRNRKAYNRRKASPERRARDRAQENAKSAALRRLRALHPGDYAAILAEERAKRDLEPWPLTVALQGSPPEETFKTLRE